MELNVLGEPLDHPLPVLVESPKAVRSEETRVDLFEFLHDFQSDVRIALRHIVVVALEEFRAGHAKLIRHNF